VKEFLSQKGVSFKELNVAENDAARSEMIKKTGRMAVPTISVGEQVVVGFDRNALERLLPSGRST
jgi:glutaredoxin